MTISSEIEEFHAHIYFKGPEARAHTFALREGLLTDFEGSAGGVREKPGGPHPKSDLLVQIPTERFADAVPYLMLNRRGLSILVHPETGDPVADHTENALWLGDGLAVDVDFLRAFEEWQKAQTPKRRLDGWGPSGFS
ncbi:MAG: DOPA 4,5-dioxygenase family protein [Rhodospirillaceae bacterium]